jgi:hypothetical protein
VLAPLALRRLQFFSFAIVTKKSIPGGTSAVPTDDAPKCQIRR